MSLLLAAIAPHADQLHHHVSLVHHRAIVLHAAVRVAVIVHLHVAVRTLAVKLARPLSRLLAGVTLPKRLISVVTPTWNRVSLLTKRCIPSVRAQNYDGPVEHIIVSERSRQPSRWCARGDFPAPPPDRPEPGYPRPAAWRGRSPG